MKKSFFAASSAVAFVACCLVSPVPAQSVPGVSAQHQALTPLLCPRYEPGSSVVEPKDLFSSHGVLRVSFRYSMRVDQAGNTHYCFMTQDGVQSPTLHVHPGDQLLITLKNEVPAALKPSFRTGPIPHMQEISGIPDVAVSGRASLDCVGGMDVFATVPRRPCHQSEVVKTFLDAEEMIQYDVHFSSTEAPGLYWYHPHIRGIAEPAMQGGASGAIIVEGIQDIHHDVAGLPQRTLIVRDNLLSGYPDPGGIGPVSDLSLNYIPVAYPGYTPAVIAIKPLQKQFWRVLNASADTVLDLEVQYDGTPQSLEVVGDGGTEGKTAARNHILLAPAGRAEFVVTGPGEFVKNARLITLKVNTGSAGQTTPERPLATIKSSAFATDPGLFVPNVSELPAVSGSQSRLAIEVSIDHPGQNPSSLD